MTLATKKLTFEEYLAHDDGTDMRYELVNRLYEEQEFRGGDRVSSTTFPELTLTAEQILTAGGKEAE
jgi:Uma2 family endonuclease